jgi:hypothetical protein
MLGILVHCDVVAIHLSWDKTFSQNNHFKGHRDSDKN